MKFAVGLTVCFIVISLNCVLAGDAIRFSKPLDWKRKWQDENGQWWIRSILNIQLQNDWIIAKVDSDPQIAISYFGGRPADEYDCSLREVLAVNVSSGKAVYFSMHSPYGDDGEQCSPIKFVDNGQLYLLFYGPKDSNKCTLVKIDLQNEVGEMAELPQPRAMEVLLSTTLRLSDPKKQIPSLWESESVVDACHEMGYAYLSIGHCHNLDLGDLFASKLSVGVLDVSASQGITELQVVSNKRFSLCERELGRDGRIKWLLSEATFDQFFEAPSSETTRLQFADTETGSTSCFFAVAGTMPTWKCFSIREGVVKDLWSWTDDKKAFPDLWCSPNGDRAVFKCHPTDHFHLVDLKTSEVVDMPPLPAPWNAAGSVIECVAIRDDGTCVMFYNTSSILLFDPRTNKCREVFAAFPECSAKMIGLQQFGD